MIKFVNTEFLTPGVDETTIFDIFSGFAQVKDIRLIRDKFEPEKFRNFVFVEYYTIADAEKVISTVKRNPMKINGERVFITYSKLKRDDQPAATQENLYSVPETSLQFDPLAHKTSFEDEEKYFKPNEILRSEQLISTKRVLTEEKSKEQLEKEKIEQDLK